MWHIEREKFEQRSGNFLGLRAYIYCFEFFFFFATPCGMEDLSSPARDWTLTPWGGSMSLNHWTTREVLICFEFLISMILLFTQSYPTFCNPMDHIACQASLSMEFSRREYWNGLPFPFLGDLLDPGIESRSPALQADSLPSEPPGKSHP